MTLTEARSILDDVRAGAAQWRSEAEITAALRETGDVPDASIQIVRPAGSCRSLLPSQYLPASPFDGLAALPRTLARAAREAA